MEDSLDDDFFYSTKIGKYAIENTILGLGRFGTVKIGVKNLPTLKVAVKIVQKNSIFEEETLKYDHGDVFKEIRIMQRLKHSHLIELFDYYENEIQFCLVLEMAEKGDLLKLIEKKGRLSETVVLRYCNDIIAGLSFMHSRCIAHRDVKAENVMVCGNGLKLTDFGFSVDFDKKGKKKIVTRCGTLFYVAPEILKGKGHVGPEVDVWAMGVLIYFMLTGNYPFSGANEFDIVLAIKHINYPDHPHLTDGAKDLIAQLFVPLKYRTDIDNMKQHSWFSGKTGVFKESMQRSNPTQKQKRISCHSGSLSTLIDETCSDSESSLHSQGVRRRLSSSQRKLGRTSKRCTAADLRASLKRVKPKTRSRTFYHETREDGALFDDDSKAIEIDSSHLSTQKYFKSMDHKMTGKKQKKRERKKRKGTIEVYRDPVPLPHQRISKVPEIETELTELKPNRNSTRKVNPQSENHDTKTELTERKPKHTVSKPKSRKSETSKKSKKSNSESERNQRKKSPLSQNQNHDTDTELIEVKPNRHLSKLKSRRSESFKKSKNRYSENQKKRYSETIKKRKLKRYGSEKDSGSDSKSDVKNRDFLKKSRKMLSARKEEKKLEKKSPTSSETYLPPKRRRKKSNTLTSENRPVLNTRRKPIQSVRSESNIEVKKMNSPPPESSGSIHEDASFGKNTHLIN